MMDMKWSVSGADQRGSDVTAGEGTLRRKATERQKTPVGGAEVTCAVNTEKHACGGAHIKNTLFLQRFLCPDRHSPSWNVFWWRKTVRTQRRHLTPDWLRYAIEPLESTANGDELRFCCCDCFQPREQWLARFWHSQRCSVDTNNWGKKSQKQCSEFRSVVNTETCDAVITACNCRHFFFEGKTKGRRNIFHKFLFLFCFPKSLDGGWSCATTTTQAKFSQLWLVLPLGFAMRENGINNTLSGAFTSGLDWFNPSPCSKQQKNSV